LPGFFLGEKKFLQQNYAREENWHREKGGM
jgi:hypothetical protein